MIKEQLLLCRVMVGSQLAPENVDRLRPILEEIDGYLAGKEISPDLLQERLLEIARLLGFTKADDQKDPDTQA